MKKTLILILCIVLLGCKEHEVRYTQNSPEIDALKENIKNYNDKNWEALTKHYADTSKTFFNTRKKGMSTKEIIDYHKANDENYSNRGFDLSESEYEMVVTDEGHTWVNFWGDWSATLKGNNKTVNIPVHLTSQFIDGKIVRESGYWDPTEIVLMLQEMEAAKAVDSTSSE
ncbi:nuclear transport factor 2 family protein [Pontimicrobium sp. IMCC45349]|uniref:nuclear transport factor 2 family protein n=1 Tax=Pontimicrobium sp. IMCC45349 TaxID=3391574 RepID=UPI0039A0B8C0